MLCDDLVGRARSTWCKTPADIQMTQQIIATASPRTQYVCDRCSAGFARAVDVVLHRHRPAFETD
jgi:hypothetical protein